MEIDNNNLKDARFIKDLAWQNDQMRYDSINHNSIRGAEYEERRWFKPDLKPDPTVAYKIADNTISKGAINAYQTQQLLEADLPIDDKATKPLGPLSTIVERFKNIASSFFNTPMPVHDTEILDARKLKRTQRQVANYDSVLGKKETIYDPTHNSRESVQRRIARRKNLDFNIEPLKPKAYKKQIDIDMAPRKLSRKRRIIISARPKGKPKKIITMGDVYERKTPGELPREL
jgi:hypothetical protein